MKYEPKINNGATSEYNIIPLDVLEDSRISEKNKIVFLLFDRFRNGDGEECYFTNEELAQEIGKSRKWTTRAFKELKKYNYVVKGKGFVIPYINLEEYRKKGKYIKVPSLLVDEVRKCKLSLDELIFYLILLRGQMQSIVKDLRCISKLDLIDYKKNYRIKNVRLKYSTIKKYYKGNDNYKETKFNRLVEDLSKKRIKIRGNWIPLLSATIKNSVYRGKKSKLINYSCNIIPPVDEQHHYYIKEVEEEYKENKLQEELIKKPAPVPTVDEKKEKVEKIKVTDISNKQEIKKEDKKRVKNNKNEDKIVESKRKLLESFGIDEEDVNLSSEKW